MRMKALGKWIESDRPCIILTQALALAQETYSPEALVLRRQHLRPKDTVAVEDLLENLQSMGYSRVPLAVQTGEFCPEVGTRRYYHSRGQSRLPRRFLGR